MKEMLINKLFEEFEVDKEIMKQNLLKVMDEIILETKDEYNKITLTIKIEKN